MNKLLLLLCAGTLLAQDPRKIIEESQKLHRSRSQQYEGVLEVYDSKGGKNEKRWQFVLRFLAPALVKGVALLVHNHPDRASDQWMWTPELNRDRRIALQDRSTRFFGTDFSFEDLEERDVDQSDYKLLGEETLAGQPCYKIEAIPKKARNSQYSRSIVWVRKDILLPIQLELFVKNELTKRLSYRRVEKVQNIWSPLEMEMSDLKKKTRTILKTEKLKYDISVGDEQFTLQALRRGE
jgi:outer membrane lipoprotein-sorting protein